MTPARTQYRRTHPAPRSVVDDSEGHGPRVWDDMTVEVALAVMAGARVQHLTVCDGDDESAGLITLARLAVLRDSSTYTDRIRLRDVLDGSLPSQAGFRAYSTSHADAPRPGRPCHDRPETVGVGGSTRLRTASALLGGTGPVEE
ncbi:CBS domain-containing protein [Streptomyces sp. SAS_269]|uniref:CBS domain-containing protein n=1 Tax=Streptomyces sp. SAS_269 TaxID=3412749 RepID=UPI00403C547A